MAIESETWIRAFVQRDAGGEATEQDYRRMAAHIQTSCDEIRQGWSEDNERYRRTGLRAIYKLPFTVARISLGEIAAAAESVNSQ